jgi:hypothetical protein
MRRVDLSEQVAVAVEEGAVDARPAGDGRDAGLGAAGCTRSRASRSTPVAECGTSCSGSGLLCDQRDRTGRMSAVTFAGSEPVAEARHAARVVLTEVQVARNPGVGRS